MALANHDALYEEFREALEAVEDVFCSRFKHGAQITLPVSGRILRFGKRDADWMLFIDTLRNPDNTEAQSWQPLTNSPTDVRIEATRHLCALWDACTAVEVERTRDVREAIEAARVFVGLSFVQSSVKETASRPKRRVVKETA